jgi:ribose transport system substrate-binding protein
MTRWIAAAALALLTAVAAAACNRTAPGDPGADASTPGGETIAFFTKNQTNPYFQSIRLAADSAAKQMNANVVHYVPTKPDSIPEQMSQIEDVIIRRPAAVVFIPVDYKAMVPGVQKLNSAKIPVINITDRSAGGQLTSFMGCDERGLARATARYLLQAMNGRGNVVILEGVGGSGNSISRVAGFNEAIKESPGVRLLASQPANFQRLMALQVMENLLQSYPQIDGVLAGNDSMALGAVEALEAANRKALVIGLNGTKEAVDAIKAGRLLASGDCDGFLQGCMGTMAAVRHLRNLPVPAEFEFPIQVIDKSNYTGADVPYEQRTCPMWDSVVTVAQGGI